MRFAQGLLQRDGSGFAVVSVDDQLRQHRVVKRRNFGSAFDPGFHARIRRKRDLSEKSHTGLKVFRRVFRINAHLHRMTAARRRFEYSIFKYSFTGGQTNHPFDQIDTGDFFGHAVLDLQARVDFQKIKLAAFVIEHKLDRARVSVTHSAAQAQRRFIKSRALRIRKTRRRSFFDHFLVASLHAAIAFAQRNNFAISVAENLHFDVARARHETLEIQTGVVEIALRQAPDAFVSFAQGGFIIRQTHPDAAAARRAFQHHGKADALRFRDRVFDIAQQLGARQNRHVFANGDGARGVFTPELAHILRRRPDERDARIFAPLREIGVFRKKTVARMNRLRAAFNRGLEDFFRVEISC